MSPPTSPVTLTVVVAAWNDPLHLRACLQSLRAASRQHSFELIVAFPAGRGFELSFSDELAGADGIAACAVAVSAGATVPQLRKAGLARASGTVVAFTEDHAIVGPEWSAALLREYEAAGVAAVGGPVAQSEALGSLDWAMYLFDYGRFMPPLRSGPVRELSGLNMSFAKSVFVKLETTMPDGVIEGPLFEHMRHDRHEMHLAPLAIVYHNKRYRLREAVVSVFYLGRGYAGRRLERARRLTRWGRALSCLLLPAFLLGRILAAGVRRSRAKWRVVSSFGYLFLLVLSWSAGECVGYLAGSGDSDTRWR